ncbi:ATP-binding protein [Abyssisolibacter fermentans]|uniref:ATP-binding protein n=1 Tax=Abyssisolibacter fermentans TaxID=1766203 RepID=UPI000830AB28|nr:transporter substrate-binding domain-containing protein [Abyssisolibacter fermentans]
MKKVRIFILMIILIIIIISIIVFCQPKKYEEVYIEGNENIRRDIFTAEQLKWIDANKDTVFKVGLAKDYVPIEYLDEDGHLKGLGTEVLRKVHEFTGLKFKLYENIQNETWDDMLNNIYTKKVDILPTVSFTKKRAENIIFSKPYIETTLVILGHKDNSKVANNLKILRDETFVAAKGYWTVDNLLMENSNSKITLVKNAKEAIKYIDEKKADYTICEIPVYTYYTEQNIYRNIKIIGEIKNKNPIMVGVRKGLEPLCDIINETIENINQDELYEKALVIPKTNYKEKKLTIIVIVLISLLSIVVYYLYNTFIQLLKAKKDVEKANKEITKFMTNISHDLRTPITVILGYTQAIIDGHVKQQKDKDKYIERIYKRTKYLNELIEDFFLVARLEDNKITLLKEEVDINKLINNMVLDMELNFKKKNINVFINLDSNINQPKEVDRLKMYRAIENLINNAIKYSKQNGTIKIGTNLLDNGQVKIFIEDNGIGIQKEDIPYLFERYYKGKNKGVNKESFGLGLYITKEIINKHNGQIWVKSELNKGSIFYIKI